ncbi:transmembrane adaptor Erv26 [Delphinella strobiligena]|nr:transmembrane adaptor Erv26 [Delphinella strobiligena]
MWILPLVGYLGLLLGFAFLTLAIASGLYYLSELVEEHSVFTKKLLTRLIYTVVVIQVLLALFDKFPWALSALGIASHIIYAQNLRRFPVVKLTDPIFILSCALVLLNHWLWFRHFSAPPPRSYSYYSPTSAESLPTFTEIAAFFGLEVWLVPFALFVSLSAGENVLPTMGSEYATGAGSSFISPGKIPDGAETSAYASAGQGRRKRSGTNAGMAKAAVNGMREWIGETGEVMGLWKGEKTRAYL